MAYRTKTIHYPLDLTGSTTLSSQCYCRLWDDSAGTFTNADTAANNSTTADISFPNAVDDIIYVGSVNTARKFNGVTFLMSTAAGGSFVREWEYWNGASWTSLTVTGSNRINTATSNIYWESPSDWATTTVNGVDTYWIRLRTTSVSGAAGVGTYICIAGEAEFSQTIYIPENGDNDVKVRDFTYASSQYFSRTNYESLQLNTNKTFSAWIKKNSSGNGYISIFQKGDKNAVDTPEVYLLHANTITYFAVLSEDYTQSSSLSTDFTMEPDRWYFILAEINLDESKLKLMIDNNKYEATLAITPRIADGTFFIGYHNALGLDLYSDGKIASVGIWNRILEEDEKYKLMNNGASYHYDELDDDLKEDLVSYYNLDEASGDALDSHTGGLDLTDNNSVGSTTSGPKARHILSAQVEINYHTSNAGNIHIHKLDGKINSGSISNSSSTIGNITNTGEHISNLYKATILPILNNVDPADTSFTLTLYFGANIGPTTTATTLQNLDARIFITYVAKEQSTRIKTVAIPLQGNTGGLSTSLTQYETIPALDTLLPEASKTYREIWFEVSGNSVSLSTTTIDLKLALDSETEYDTPSLSNGLNSACWERYIWSRNDMDTSTTHSFKARTSSTNNPFRCLCPVLWVTYEYDHDSSTEVINSIQIPIVEEPGFIGNGTTNKSKELRQLYIQEPGTITIKNSGVLLNWMSSTNIGNISISINGISSSFFSSVTPNLACGQFGLMDRKIDVVTFSRGLNNIYVDWYGSVNNQGAGLAGIAFINYTSGIHEEGDGAHNKTLWFHMLDMTTASQASTISFSPPLICSCYWLNGIGYRWSQLTDAADKGMVLNVEINSDESIEDGKETIFSQFSQSDAEMSYIDSWVRSRSYFKRHFNDADTSRLNLLTNRRYFTQSSDATHDTLTQLLTIHQIAYTISGTISGYSGDGSGITVELHRSDTDECIGRTTTKTGGTYSFVWFDNTIPVYAHVVDGNKVGRSPNNNAV